MLGDPSAKKSILITGACGFIASHVCRDLVRAARPPDTCIFSLMYALVRELGGDMSFSLKNSFSSAIPPRPAHQRPPHNVKILQVNLYPNYTVVNREIRLPRA